MEPKFWKEKWAANEIQFHCGVPNEHLVAYFSKLPPQRVVVPLCGKSLDMAWLHKQGHEVMGFELSPLACEAFFQENALPFQKTALGQGELFQGDRIALWCGDIFQSPLPLWDKTQSIYDRAALVALPAALRKRYAAFLAERLKAPSRYLLLTYEYQSDRELGPPFSVPAGEVNDLFASSFAIRHLQSGVSQELSRRAGKFEKTDVTEHVFELTKLG